MGSLLRDKVLESLVSQGIQLGRLLMEVNIIIPPTVVGNDA